MVTTGASLLLSPLLWDHYLSMLVLPAALLADRGRPWAIALPVVAWLPVIDESWTVLYPAIAMTATFLPFIARTGRPEPLGEASAAAESGAESAA